MGKPKLGTIAWMVGGLAAFGAMIPHLEKVAWLINAPKVAYAAQDTATQTEVDFDKFLAVFQAQQQVQQAYYEKQMQEPVRIERRWGRDYCCTGDNCWPYNKESGCQ